MSSDDHLLKQLVRVQTQFSWTCRAESLSSSLSPSLFSSSSASPSLSFCVPSCSIDTLPRFWHIEAMVTIRCFFGRTHERPLFPWLYTRLRVIASSLPSFSAIFPSSCSFVFLLVFAGPFLRFLFVVAVLLRTSNQSPAVGPAMSSSRRASTSAMLYFSDVLATFSGEVLRLIVRVLVSVVMVRGCRRGTEELHVQIIKIRVVSNCHNVDLNRPLHHQAVRLIIIGAQMERLQRYPLDHMVHLTPGGIISNTADKE